MSKKLIGVISVLGILALALAGMITRIRQSRPPEMTFAACEQMGGAAWMVDLYHPDICPSCAEYRECEVEYNDYSDVCPDCAGPCQECQGEYSLLESCPACYGPCQACQNEYLNEFENEEERYELCPECEVCDSCREELNRAIANCLPCTACDDCKEENRKYDLIGDVCPQFYACDECLEKNGPFPDKCPDGRMNVGQITDAATWFQCCK